MQKRIKNPFLGNNEGGKVEFVRHDPEFAKFYKEESRTVEIPIFGKNRNITFEERLAKRPDNIRAAQSRAAEFTKTGLPRTRLYAPMAHVKNKAKLNLTVREEQRNKLEQMASLGEPFRVQSYRGYGR